MTTTFDESKVRRGQPANSGQFRSKTSSAPTSVLGVAEPQGSLKVGGDLTPVTAASTRRTLAPGQRVQVIYPGRHRSEDGPIVRTVTKQTPNQMITTDHDGKKVHLDWPGTKVSTDEAGNFVFHNKNGLPFAAMRPLDDGEPGEADVVVDLPQADYYIRARQSTDPDELDRIADDCVPATKKALTQNIVTRADTLTKIVQTTDDERIHEEAASHIAADAKTLDAVSRSKHFRARFYAARHELTPVDRVVELASDRMDVVRRGVAMNPNTPREVLEGFVAARDLEVLDQVAEHPNTSPETLDRLARGTGNQMTSVAKNPSASAETLERLADDTSTGNQTRAMVAGNPSAPDELRGQLVRDSDKWVRQHAAKNPKLTAEEMRLLAADSNGDVRRALGKNKATNAEALHVLARDEDHFVRRAAVTNPNISPLDLELLANDELQDVAAVAAQYLKDRS